MTTIPAIEAAVFDMDGLLLDSEPFWQEAEIRVFGSVGLALTREECLDTIGVPIDEVVAMRFEQQPWTGKSREQVTAEIIAGVAELVQRRGEPLPGARETLDYVRRKHVKLGLASSSAMRLITDVTTKFGMTHMFDVLHSAENEARGKPHPDVFLSTARRLGVPPGSCVAFEDSVHGLAAALAAGMRTVVVPAPDQFGDPGFDRADLKLHTLSGFGEREWSRLAVVQPTRPAHGTGSLQTRTT